MRLGIACVYYYGVPSEWLLDLQLRYIAETLVGYDYKVYAGANRLQPELRRKLESAPNVEIVDLPLSHETGGREHAFYLDRLLWRAATEGCTHVAALDADSFPVLADWPRLLLSEMTPSIRVAAVLRQENADTHLPHPCGYFMDSSFLLERRPALYPTEGQLSIGQFQRFLDVTRQRVDTGIGYGFALWENREGWLQLLRSNLRNLHFLMAGVYGGVFFHLGASSRRPTFHADYLTKPSLRMAAHVRELPLLWRLATSLEERYLAGNERLYRGFVYRLKTDPAQFLSELAPSGLSALKRSEDGSGP